MYDLSIVKICINVRKIPRFCLCYTWNECNTLSDRTVDFFFVKQSAIYPTTYNFTHRYNKYSIFEFFKLFLITSKEIFILRSTIDSKYYLFLKCRDKLLNVLSTNTEFWVSIILLISLNFSSLSLNDISYVFKINWKVNY